jgi:hypothetical protein
VLRARPLGLVSACWLLLSIACAASAEEQTLLRFFEAARTLDRTIIEKYAKVGFDPRTDGVVQSFRLTNRAPERDGQKEVTIEAVVRAPEGSVSRKTLLVSFQRVPRGDQPSGRWFITGLRQIPASQTSRVASSAPLN